MYQYGWNNPVLRSDPNGLFPGEGLWNKFKAWLDTPIKSSGMKAATKAQQEALMGMSSEKPTYGDLIGSSVAQGARAYSMYQTVRGTSGFQVNTNTKPVALLPASKMSVAQGKAATAAAGSSGTTPYLATPDGTIIPNSASAARNSLNSAGMAGTPTRNGDGTTHQATNSNGMPYFIRVMDGNSSGRPYSGPRVVTTQDADAKQYVQPNGSPITGTVPRNNRKEIGHTHLDNQ